MNKPVSAVLMVAMLAAVATASGCIKRMKMPSEELLWQPSPDRFERGEERFEFEEVGRLEEVDGKREFLIDHVIESDDGRVIAASAWTVWDAAADDTNDATERRYLAHGVVIFPLGGGESEWVPAPVGGHGGDEELVPSAFSPDTDLLAMRYAGREYVWSRSERRFVYGLSYDGSVRYGVGVIDGVLTRGRTNRPVLFPSQQLPWTYEGVEGYVVPFRYEPVQSAGGRYLAASYASTGYFLGMGDDTPGHMRVWNTETQKLVAWSGATEELHQWNCPKPLAFLRPSEKLLYADRDGLHIVEVESRRVAASMPFPDSNVWLEKVVWLPHASVVAVEGRDSFSLIRVKE